MAGSIYLGAFRVATWWDSGKKIKHVILLGGAQQEGEEGRVTRHHGPGKMRKARRWPSLQWERRDL